MRQRQKIKLEPWYTVGRKILPAALSLLLGATALIFAYNKDDSNEASLRTISVVSASILLALFYWRLSVVMQEVILDPLRNIQVKSKTALKENESEPYIAQLNHSHDQIIRHLDMSWKIVVYIWAMYGALIYFYTSLVTEPEFKARGLLFSPSSFLVLIFGIATGGSIFHVFSEVMQQKFKQRYHLLAKKLKLIDPNWDVPAVDIKWDSVRRFGSIAVFGLVIWGPLLCMLLKRSTNR